MSFTLGSIATSGFPEGQYAVRIDDVEAGRNGGNTGDTMKFSATCVVSDNPAIKPGAKQLWSYTYEEQYISILGNDLVKAGLPRDLEITKNTKQDAAVYGSLMRGALFLIAVVAQKKDPSRTNTHFVGPYTGTAVGVAPAAAPVAVAPAPVPAAAPAPVPAAAPAPIAAAPAPISAVAPPVAVAPPAVVAPVSVAPVAVAPVLAAAAPQSEHSPLDGLLIAAVMAAKSGTPGAAYPVLNARQVGQLREIGMGDVATQYEAALTAAAPPPAPVPAAVGAAFAAV
jgi:hypothetical protein